MTRLGRFIIIATALVGLCCGLRPNLASSGGLQNIESLYDSLRDLQESTADAGISHAEDLNRAADDALKLLKFDAIEKDGNVVKELPKEATDALSRVVQVIQDTMWPTLDGLQRDERELVGEIHGEVTDCNTGMANRLAPDGDIGLARASAESLRDEVAELARQVEDLQAQNVTKHAEIAALMSGGQPPLLCSSYPTVQMEELWVEYFRHVDEYYAVATVQNRQLSERRAERDGIVEVLVQTTELHVSKSGALGAVFCDWKNNLQSACAAHDTCYSEKSARLTEQLQLFGTARDKRIAAYRASLTLIDRINAMIDEDAAPAADDAETRFPSSGLEVPQKQPCDVSVLHGWDSSIYGCGDSGEAQEYELTTCGATGAHGPDQAACDASYTEQSVEVVDGYQIINITKTGEYVLTAVGASGGSHGTGLGGYGARAVNVVTLQAGERLVVTVGQVGWSNPSNAQDWGGCGGGATVIAKVDGDTSGTYTCNTIGERVLPLAIAGGGAGLQNRRTSGQAEGGRAIEGEPDSRALGGWSSGGAGFIHDGSPTRQSRLVHAKSFLNGFTGGRVVAVYAGAVQAGFGGGGSPNRGGGGGGGYDGGDCTIGGIDHDCYGGSSYAGEEGTMEANVNAGPGHASVTLKV